MLRELYTVSQTPPHERLERLIFDIGIHGIDVAIADAALLTDEADLAVSKAKEVAKATYAALYLDAMGKTDKMKDAEILTTHAYQDAIGAVASAQLASFQAKRELSLWEKLAKEVDKLHFMDLKNVDRSMLDQGKYGGAASRAGRQAN